VATIGREEAFSTGGVPVTEFCALEDLGIVAPDELYELYEIYKRGRGPATGENRRLRLHK
jgi:hypothetical protein